MRIFEFEYHTIPSTSGRVLALDHDQLSKFDPGDNAAPYHYSQVFDALVVFFDLEGFTSFCDRSDGYLSIEPYVCAFEDWIFKEIVLQFTREDVQSSATDHIVLWEHLPVFWKFTGDGGFFIWRLQQTDFSGDRSVGNIVVRCKEVAKNYRANFALKQRQPESLPSRLRCGIARGQVIALQRRADFVGACINMAARLQKIQTLGLAIRLDGIKPERCFEDRVRDAFVECTYPVRGPREPTAILVDREEFEALAPEERNSFVAC